MYQEIKNYPAFDDKQGYGFFGYPGAMVDRAVRTDDPIGLQAMMDAGWITKDSKTMDNFTMSEYCERNGSLKCAELFA